MVLYKHFVQGLRFFSFSWLHKRALGDCTLGCMDILLIQKFHLNQWKKEWPKSVPIETKTPPMKLDPFVLRMLSFIDPHLVSTQDVCCMGSSFFAGVAQVAP